MIHGDGDNGPAEAEHHDRDGVAEQGIDQQGRGRAGQRPATGRAGRSAAAEKRQSSSRAMPRVEKSKGEPHIMPDDELIIESGPVGAHRSQNHPYFPGIILNGKFPGGCCKKACYVAGGGCFGGGGSQAGQPPADAGRRRTADALGRAGNSGRGPLPPFSPLSGP